MEFNYHFIMNKYVSGAISVEVQIGTKEIIFLPDVLDLKNKRIKHIDIANGMNYAPSGREIGSPDGYLTLVELNTKEQLISDLSFSQLNLGDNVGNRLFINKIVDFNQSFVRIVNPSDYIRQSIVLVFWFDEPTTMNYIVEKNGKTKIDTIEIPIVNNVLKKFAFPDNRTLIGCKFQNLLLVGGGDGKTPQGNSLLSYELIYKGYLTLKSGQLEFFRQVPLQVFYQTGAQFPLRLQNIQFDFTNSFVEFLPDNSNLSNNMAILFNVIVDDND